MSIQSLNPYITLNGDAEKAIKHYANTLGAKTDRIMRWGDVPEMKTPPEYRNRVMHAEMNIGGGIIIIADGKPGTTVSPENNGQICLHFDDVDDMTKRFGALAEGGKITMPLDDTFWGARFGTLTDSFGMRWLFNCMLKKA